MGVGLLLKLLLKAPLLLDEDVQAVVSDLGQTDPLDELATDGKTVARFLALASNAGSLLPNESFVNRLAALLSDILQSCEGRLRDLSAKHGPDRYACREELVPHVSGRRRVDLAVVCHEEKHDPLTVPVHGGNRDSPQGPDALDFL